MGGIDHRQTLRFSGLDLQVRTLTWNDLQRMLANTVQAWYDSVFVAAQALYL
jgi:hypothetical protein